MSIRTRQLKIDGMQCAGCEDSIIDVVKALPGICAVRASYVEQKATVEYDDDWVGEENIIEAITAKGYGVRSGQPPRTGNIRRALIFVLLLVMVGGVAFWGKSQMPGLMPLIKPHMDHLLLLGIGFLTGFHCIGMCGAMVVGYTDPNRSKVRQLLGHLSYGFGKTLSYSTLGAGFGLLGATIAITPTMRGIAALAASVFLLLYGLKMLEVFSALRRFTLRLPQSAKQEIASQLRKHRSPLMTGLLTGLLLGCGPLQAMYVMAAGLGDPVQGALVLLMFGLGTLVPLLGFGLFATLISPATMRQLVKVSGLLVIVMGGMMAQRGWHMLQSGPTMTVSPPIQMTLSATSG